MITLCLISLSDQLSPGYVVGAWRYTKRAVVKENNVSFFGSIKRWFLGIYEDITSNAKHNVSNTTTKENDDMHNEVYIRYPMWIHSFVMRLDKDKLIKDDSNDNRG